MQNDSVRLLLIRRPASCHLLLFQLLFSQGSLFCVNLVWRLCFVFVTRSDSGCHVGMFQLWRVPLHS